jgi:hypothetical protein
MCIAFDGAYILEAPPADPGQPDEHAAVREMMTAETEHLEVSGAPGTRG